MERVAEDKHKAMQEFKDRLLASEVGSYIAGISLFGSLAKGNVYKDSDIDLLVFASNDLDKVKKICSDISFDILMELNEVIEPLIYCIDQLRRPHSYFLYQATNNGREVFKMDKKRLKIEEVRGYLGLAEEYLEIATINFKNKKFRGTVDAGYNSCELSIKGMLLLKLDELPTSHSGILRKFGQFYIKEGIVSKQIGKTVSSVFTYRNQARYDFHTRIDKDMANEVIELAEELTGIVKEKANKIS